MGGVAASAGRWLLKDPLNTFLLFSSLGLTILFFVLLGQIQPNSEGERVPLSEITKLSDEKDIAAATLLDQDSRVVVDTKGGELLYAAYPKSDVQTSELVKDLTKGGAAVVVDQQADKPTKQILVQFLIPILLLVCLFVFFTRIGQDGGAGAFAGFSKFTGKGRKRNADAPDRTTFESVAGAGEAVAELREIRDYLADPGKCASVGARAPKGVLLVGPPGTGKTLLAKATAGEADAAFFSLSGSDFVESLVGVGAARVRDLFAKARKMAPALIFIDELDAAGRKRGAGVGQGNDEREQTLNALLVEMDGFGGDSGLVGLAATHRREGRSEMAQPTLEEAIDRVVAGPARKSHVLSPEERWVISIHEASHAVVTRSIGQKVSAQKLSIVAPGRQLRTAAR